MIYLWEPYTGKIQDELKLKGRTKESKVSSVAYRPDGKQLASGSLDGILLWEKVSADSKLIDAAPSSKNIYPNPRNSFQQSYQNPVFYTSTGSKNNEPPKCIEDSEAINLEEDAELQEAIRLSMILN